MARIRSGQDVDTGVGVIATGAEVRRQARKTRQHTRHTAYAMQTQLQAQFDNSNAGLQNLWEEIKGLHGKFDELRSVVKVPAPSADTNKSKRTTVITEPARMALFHRWNGLLEHCYPCPSTDAWAHLDKWLHSNAIRLGHANPSVGMTVMSWENAMDELDLVEKGQRSMWPQAAPTPAPIPVLSIETINKMFISYEMNGWLMDVWCRVMGIDKNKAVTDDWHVLRKFCSNHLNGAAVESLSDLTYAEYAEIMNKLTGMEMSLTDTRRSAVGQNKEGQ